MKVFNWPDRCWADLVVSLGPRCWHLSNISDNALAPVSLVVLSMISTETMIVLYAKPSSLWGRFGFIVGVVAIVIVILARSLADGNVLA